MREGIAQLHHVGMSVPDLAAAKSFYGEVLGMSVVSSRAWCRGDARMDAILGLKDSSGERAMLEGRGARLEIWCFDSPEGRPQPDGANVADHGISHLCFEVVDLFLLHRELAQQGVRFIGEPSVGPTGSVAVYARDPFGNFLEFFQPPP